VKDFSQSRDRIVKAALALMIVATSSATGRATGGEIPIPVHIIIAKPAPPGVGVSREIHGALLFYAGWNTGKAAYFRQALASTFVDNTLPLGRPQGPAGPPAASAQFRKLIPDLHCSVEDLIVAGDEVTIRQRYTGTAVSGRHVDFAAIDILRMHGERVAEDWHLEDYTTLNRQLGHKP
jgi:predicted ester cyclase